MLHSSNLYFEASSQEPWTCQLKKTMVLPTQWVQQGVLVEKKTLAQDSLVFHMVLIKDKLQWNLALKSKNTETLLSLELSMGTEKTSSWKFNAIFVVTCSLELSAVPTPTFGWFFLSIPLSLRSISWCQNGLSVNGLLKVELVIIEMAARRT